MRMVPGPRGSDGGAAPSITVGPAQVHSNSRTTAALVRIKRPAASTAFDFGRRDVITNSGWMKSTGISTNQTANHDPGFNEAWAELLKGRRIGGGQPIGGVIEIALGPIAQHPLSKSQCQFTMLRRSEVQRLLRG